MTADSGREASREAEKHYRKAISILDSEGLICREGIMIYVEQIRTRINYAMLLERLGRVSQADRVRQEAYEICRCNQ